MSWSDSMGVTFVEQTVEKVVAELSVDDRHLQAFGLVHGGVYSGLIETVASMGAWLTASARGQTVVGVENHTSFLRSCKSGMIRACATPLSRGKTTQLWDAVVCDSEDNVLAVGRVRLVCRTDESLRKS